MDQMTATEVAGAPAMVREVGMTTFGRETEGPLPPHNLSRFWCVRERAHVCSGQDLSGDSPPNVLGKRLAVLHVNAYHSVAVSHRPAVGYDADVPIRVPRDQSTSGAHQQSNACA